MLWQVVVDVVSRKVVGKHKHVADEEQAAGHKRNFLTARGSTRARSATLSKKMGEFKSGNAHGEVVESACWLRLALSASRGGCVRSVFSHVLGECDAVWRLAEFVAHAAA